MAIACFIAALQATAVGVEISLQTDWQKIDRESIYRAYSNSV